MDASTRPRPGSREGPARLLAGLPVFDSFENLTDPTIYTPLPADWLIGSDRHRALDRRRSRPAATRS